MYALLNSQTEEVTTFTDWMKFQCHIRANLIRNDVPHDISFHHMMELYKQVLPDQYDLIEETYKQYFSSLHCFLDPTTDGGHPYVETLHTELFYRDQSVKVLTDIQQHFREIKNMRVAYKASIYLTDRFPDKVYFQLHQQSMPTSEENTRLHQKLTRIRSINEFLVYDV